MTLQQLRTRIDQIDRHLLQHLTRRARLAIRVGRIKKQQGRQLFDPTRERTILLRMAHANRGPLSDEAVGAIYREILRQIRRLEQSV